MQNTHKHMTQHSNTEKYLHKMCGKHIRMFHTRDTQTEAEQGSPAPAKYKFAHNHNTKSTQSQSAITSTSLQQLVVCSSTPPSTTKVDAVSYPYPKRSNHTNHNPYRHKTTTTAQYASTTPPLYPPSRISKDSRNVVIDSFEKNGVGSG
eukprot:c13111_g1_i5.p1 GENE.c13111_g1_i5~~c13111_g1_i5.p1  ORF type:complete len:149 (-),score=38.21 c13111_g1_i5:274-720(-)